MFVLHLIFHFALINSVLDGKFWDFTSDLAKGDTAYTTLALGAHTDTTYFVSYILPFYPLYHRNHDSTTTDRPVRPSTLSPTFTYRRHRRRIPSRRRFLRRVDPQGATP